MEYFRQVQWAYKFSDANVQLSFRNAVKGTPLMPRDLFLMAASGRMHRVIDDQGRSWWSVAAIQNISDSLDVVAQLPGQMLIRRADRWGPIQPGAAGQVLTWDLTTGLPVWADASGGGGGTWGSITGDIADQTDLEAALTDASGSAAWGSIGGSITDQTDLETALAAKLNYTDFTNTGFDGGKLVFWEFGGPAPSTPGAGGLFSMGADDTGSGQPYMVMTNADAVNYMLLFAMTANDRFALQGSKSYEFNLTPYVNTGAIFHAGNLTFGSGLSYDPITGALTLGGLAAIAFSGSGADLAAHSVTFAQAQNLSGTDKVLGRQSAGVGPIEEITCTQAGRDLLAGATVPVQRTIIDVYSTTEVLGRVTPFELRPSIPAAINFTLQNGAGGTNGVVMADFQRGVSILQNGTPGATGQIRFARHDLVAAGQAFTLTARMQPMDPSQAYAQAQQDCLILRNSANGRMILMGQGGSDANIYVQIFSSYTSGQLGQYTAFSVAHQFPWRRIVVSAAGAITFFVSRDGYFWVPGAAGTTIGNYLGALDEVGVGMQSIPNVATQHGLVLYSYTFV